MNIFINGNSTEIEQLAHLQDVLPDKDKQSQKIVFLLNGQIRKDNPFLKDGDRVDIITLAGGG